MAIGAAVVAGVGAAVLAEGPQESVPLAVSNPPVPTPTLTADPVPEGPSQAAAATASPSTPAPATARPSPVAPELITNGPRDVPKVAITFDTAFSDGTKAQVDSGVLPAQYNAGVLDYLQGASVPATVFVTGLWAEQYPDAMKRMVDNPGIEIGNHTWSHYAWTPDCYGLPELTDPVAQKFDIARTAQLIARYTGSQPAYIRFPGLCQDSADVELAAEFGETTVGSDIELNDTGVTDAQAVVAGLMDSVQPGSIIVLHLNGAPSNPVTVAILEQLVPALKERGLTPVKVSELLAPQPAPSASPAASPTG